jgi:hypothetical protein
LLQTILEKNIDLYDHETIVNENNRRLIGLEDMRNCRLIIRFAGSDSKFGLFKLAKAETLSGKRADQSFEKTGFASVKICDYRIRKVGGGIKEILDAMKIKEVSIENYNKLCTSCLHQIE